LVPPQRNDWVSAADVEIRTMAAQEGAVLADVETSMLAAAGDDLGQLFVDHLHPNARGQQIIADTFFNAILDGRAGASAPSRPAPSLPPARGGDGPGPRRVARGEVRAAGERALLDRPDLGAGAHGGAGLAGRRGDGDRLPRRPRPLHRLLQDLRPRARRALSG